MMVGLLPPPPPIMFLTTNQSTMALHSISSTQQTSTLLPTPTQIHPPTLHHPTVAIFPTAPTLTETSSKFTLEPSLYIFTRYTPTIHVVSHTIQSPSSSPLSSYTMPTHFTVPNNVELPTLPPTSPRQESDMHAIISVSPRQARSLANALLHNGYHIIWTTAYTTGPSFKPYMDVILTNSTQVDTRGFLDLTFNKMNETLFQMKDEGYFPKYISDRRRGSDPSAPSYNAVFIKRPDYIETQVFLRESVDMYNLRLIDMKSKAYRLISHSFCEIKGRTETTAVYIRDRRVLHNITIGRQPAWESYYNRSFLQFTRDTLRLSPQKFYPIFVETNTVNGESRFAAIYLEQLDDIGTWYRWGVATESTRETFEVEEVNWEPVMSTSYNYNGLVNHFFVFQRRQYFF